LEISRELKALYEEDKDAKKVLDLAMQIEGNARHISVHAAGVVIAPTEITNFTPVQLDPAKEKVITQYDMDALDPNVSPGQAVGLLKFDLLGLRNLSILGSAIEIIHETTGKAIDLHKIPLNDEKTFAMLSRGETMGVFQLAGGGMTKYLTELKPERVEDLMAMVALYRPGPMAQIPEYIERKNNPEKISYFDPRMKEYLDKSYGLLVYQDDVFATAIKIAGYTWEEADKFRKAVGKKIPEEMEKQKQKFLDGAVAGGLPQERAEELFKLIEPFSGYGFNKAHAASYGMVAYQTAYMKANYPVEFMTALMTAESGDIEKIAQAVNEARRMGIKVLPPDINESAVDFQIVADKESIGNQAIRFGFSAIKNVGKAAIEAILEARKNGPFGNFADFLARVDGRRVNKRVLESLIKVGALQAFGKRAALLASVDEIKSKVGKRTGNEGQQGLFGKEEVMSAGSSQVLHQELEEFNDEELQNLERQLLGLSLSAKPISEVIEELIQYRTHRIYDLSGDETTINSNVKVAAVVSEVRVIITKKTGAEMAFVKIEDDTGTIDLVVFPSIYQQTRQYWIEAKPLLISGKVDQRDETLSLIVAAVDTPETAQTRQNTFAITIPEDATKGDLQELKKLLTAHPGSHEVTLVFAGSGEEIRLNFGVAWSRELSAAIAHLFKKL
jgi:DNA polymerase-3 subunit alpha